MIPKFHVWIEDIGVSVSEPQHEKGEDNLSLDRLVEKKIKELINSVKIKKNTRPEQSVDENQIINSIKSYLEKISPQQQEPQENPDAQPQENPDQLGTQDSTESPQTQPPMQQPMQL